MPQAGPIRVEQLSTNSVARYNDDEPKAAPQAAEQPSAPAPAAEADASTAAAETNGQTKYDDYQPAEQDDDDNDVDFDLGDAQQPVMSPVPAPQRDVPESPPPPVAGASVKAPGSSKEDG